MAFLILGTAALLEVRPQGRVGVRGLPGFVLPPTCFSREVLGIECPGCGLTRSFVHLAHGDWLSSLRSHRIGWLLMAAVLLQIPYRIHALRNSGKTLFSTRMELCIGSILIALQVGNWLLGFAMPWIFGAAGSGG